MGVPRSRSQQQKVHTVLVHMWPLEVPGVCEEASGTPPHGSVVQIGARTRFLRGIWLIEWFLKPPVTQPMLNSSVSDAIITPDTEIKAERGT